MTNRRIYRLALLVLAVGRWSPAACGGSEGDGSVCTESTTTTTTSPAPTVGSTTTTGAKPIAQLAGDGLGVAVLGDALEPATAALAAALGPADYQGRWTDRFCDTGEGGGGQLFAWGDLGVMFSDEKDGPTGIVPPRGRATSGATSTAG